LAALDIAAAAASQTTCVFIFFALDLSTFDELGFPGGRSRRENVTRMVDAIFKGNGDARIVGRRKCERHDKPPAADSQSIAVGSLWIHPDVLLTDKWWMAAGLAKQRSEELGGLLFAPESRVAFEEQAAAYGVALPDMAEVDVAVSDVVVAGKL
jgi:hypothetical protein